MQRGILIGDKATVRANPTSQTVRGGERITIIEIRYTEATVQVEGLPPGKAGQRRILREDIVIPEQLRLL